MWKKPAVALVAAALFLPLPASALQTDELLALVAMPLAVAAVSETTDIPMSDLMDVVALLNDAAVPPAQFIEVVRYVPVALVVNETPERPRFVEFVRTQEQQGLRGLRLVTVIEREIRTYGLPGVNLVGTPRVVVIDDDFVPVVVRTRIAESRRHPHGGPPGQLKKQLGLKTGAEVVHGDRSDARERAARRVADREDDRDDDDGRGKAHVTKERKARGSDGGDHGRGRGNDGGKGQSKGHGKGHGKGKG